MKIGKQIEVETLNLKFISESLEIAEQQLRAGSDDLHFRLSHFRKRVLSKDVDKYDIHFFGEKINEANSRLNNSDSKEIITRESKPEPLIKKKKETPWLKKIYKQIVSSTHPDKFQNFPVEIIKNKYIDIYRRTVDAWQNNHDDKLLICAYEADIHVENHNALPILKKGNNQKKLRLAEIRKLLAFQWYHIPENKRAETLEKYLTSLGYEFSTEEVNKVVNLARKRKVGTRPKPLSRKRKLN